MKSATPEKEPWVEPSSRARGVLRAAQLGLLVVLLIYACAAGVLVHHDGPMVATCEAQGKAHMIWETSLTMYVVASAVMFTVLYLVALSFPLTEAADALAYSIRRYSTKEPYVHFGGRPQVRYGVLSVLPDWLFLSFGALLVFEAVVLGVFSYWGYHELYSTEPYCVGFVQYEEIPLWAFGDFTWKAQAGMAAACSLLT